MQKYNSRKEVPEKYKWDLTEIYKNDEEFEKDLKKCEEITDELKDYPGCTKDASKLYDFLEKEIKAISIWEDLYVYSYLINDQELGKEDAIKRKNKAEQLNMKLEINTSFFVPELLKLTKKEYEDLFIENKKLQEYKDMLDRIYREKEHILTEKEEQIITSLVNSMNHFDDISSTMLNSLHDYGKIKIDKENIAIATNNYSHLMKNKDKDIRIKVRNKFNKTISRYSKVNAMLLSSYVSMNDQLAKLRHFSSSWEQKMFNMNLNDKVFKTLVETTEKHLDVLQKYYRLKKDVLKLKELTCYDLNLELSEENHEYSIEEAQELVINAIKPLGKEYEEKFKKIFTKRYIDYCQYKGKCSGGYSFSTMNNDSRILMSFNNTLDSVSTIAHEGGHNVHHQFVKENNSKQYRQTPSIVAEVASLTNECLLSSYLAEHGKTREEKLAGIANILNVIVSNLYGAVREGKIEEDMYKEVENGGILTKEFLNKLSYDSLNKYYGNEVKIDKEVANSWVNRSHYYMNFYLYSYAISISAASYVASKILSKDDEILEKYIEFLKTGSDKYPKEVYEVLGINLEDKTIYEETIKYFESLIDKYYKIYNE